MFASDHGLTENCEGVGNGDSAVYPGGAPETDDDTAPERAGRARHVLLPARPPEPEDHPLRPPSQQPGLLRDDGQRDPRREQQLLRQHRRRSRRTRSSPAAIPASRRAASVFEKNQIFSNNFNDYATQGSGRRSPSVGVPLGTGILIAGGNADIVRDNKIWTTGAAARCCSPCPTRSAARPGRRPARPRTRRRPRTTTASTTTPWAARRAASEKPNGVDFWWDEFPTTPATAGTTTSAPTARTRAGPATRSAFAEPEHVRARFLPEDCGASTGTGDPAKEAMLLYCAEAAIGDTELRLVREAAEARVPQAAARPGAGRAALAARAAREPSASPCRPASLVGDTLSCAAYANRP